MSKNNKTVPPELSEPNLHGTTDARIWALEFMKRFPGTAKGSPDEADMIGWFANAIMAGVDTEGRKAKFATAEQERLVLNQLYTLVSMTQVLSEAARTWAGGVPERYLLDGLIEGIAVEVTDIFATPAWKHLRPTTRVLDRHGVSHNFDREVETFGAYEGAGDNWSVVGGRDGHSIILDCLGSGGKPLSIRIIIGGTFYQEDPSCWAEIRQDSDRVGATNAVLGALKHFKAPLKLIKAFS